MPITATRDAGLLVPQFGPPDGQLNDGQPYWTLDEGLYGLEPSLSGALRRAGFTYAGVDRPAGVLLFTNPTWKAAPDADEKQGPAQVPAQPAPRRGGKVRAGDAQGGEAPGKGQ